MTNKIFVGKLPQTVNVQQLNGLFAKFGKVNSIRIINVISFKKNMNYGYVQMNTSEETIKAINALNYSVLDGSRIQVIEAHSFDQDRISYYTPSKNTRYKRR